MVATVTAVEEIKADPADRWMYFVLARLSDAAVCS